MMHITFGIASFSPSGDSQDEVVVRADRKLYESKRKGKNTISH